ncbi:hypothetical protein HY643_03065, partial [Candidatus Woesearchaeota archaeon]|nr:hypothetical protein [Candidatus Woesearchaeota archaeon]
YNSKGKYSIGGSGTGLYSGYNIKQTIGAAEKFVGIDLLKINGNRCTSEVDYNNLKAVLKFPPNNDFAIYVATSFDAEGHYTLDASTTYCQFKSLYEGADVIVKEMRDWVLNPQDLSTTSAVINIQVW